MTEPARAPLRTYSKGMLRRFGLAQAFLTDPELILLDEPTSNLDPTSKEMLLHAIHKAGLGRTILMITHDESTAKYCHVVRMPARPATISHSASPA